MSKEDFESGKELMQYEAELKHETEKAWLLIMDDDSEVWCPKSQCSYDGTTVDIPKWLAKTKGLPV